MCLLETALSIVAGEGPVKKKVLIEFRLTCKRIYVILISVLCILASGVGLAGLVFFVGEDCILASVVEPVDLRNKIA